MTAQAHDLVEWQSRRFLLVGVAGPGLFDPIAHGLDTRPTTTANWRGWVAHYAIKNDRLVLAELTDVGLSFEQAKAPPLINGKEATSIDHHHAYLDLDLSIAFTGRLLIAREFIQSLYRHMGFHPAWKFEESWELDLADGEITNARDLSGEMKVFRERIERGDAEDPDAVTDPGWIARTFRLDFWRSKGR